MNAKGLTAIHTAAFQASLSRSVIAAHHLIKFNQPLIVIFLLLTISGFFLGAKIISSQRSVWLDYAEPAVSQTDNNSYTFLAEADELEHYFGQSFRLPLASGEPAAGRLFGRVISAPGAETSQQNLIKGFRAQAPPNTVITAFGNCQLASLKL